MISCQFKYLGSEMAHHAQWQLCPHVNGWASWILGAMNKANQNCKLAVCEQETAFVLACLESFPVLSPAILNFAETPNTKAKTELVIQTCSKISLPAPLSHWRFKVPDILISILILIS